MEVLDGLGAEGNIKPAGTGSMSGTCVWGGSTSPSNTSTGTPTRFGPLVPLIGTVNNQEHTPGVAAALKLLLFFSYQTSCSLQRLEAEVKSNKKAKCRPPLYKVLGAQTALREVSKWGRKLTIYCVFIWT